MPANLENSVVAAAAKSLQSCPTLCDPIDSSHQALPSLGFSRQEHWGGLPFPSPMQEREKWKWSHSVVSDSSRPHGLQPTRLLHPWDFPGKSTGVGCHCLLSSGYRTRKGQFSFQFQREAMAKHVETTIQLHSFHRLARLCSKSFKLGFSSIWTEMQMYKLDLEKAEEAEIK